MVGEVTLSITRSWVENLSLPDERSNRETSRRIGFYSVYLVSLQGIYPVIIHLVHHNTKYFKQVFQKELHACLNS